MRTYAFVRNNTVLLVESILEEDYHLHVRDWEAIIDVHDLSPLPRVGWQLIGNTLLPVSPDTQQREQQIFGAALCLEMVNKMGSRNLVLSQSGSAVNVASLLSSLSVVKGLLDTGALKTARSALQAYSPAFPQHSDIINEAINRITVFLQSKGWD